MQVKLIKAAVEEVFHIMLICFLNDRKPCPQVRLTWNLLYQTDKRSIHLILFFFVCWQSAAQTGGNQRWMLCVSRGERCNHRRSLQCALQIQLNCSAAWAPTSCWVCLHFHRSTEWEVGQSWDLPYVTPTLLKSGAGAKQLICFVDGSSDCCLNKSRHRTRTWKLKMK